jgi:PAS domain S-box-containing protein
MLRSEPTFAASMARPRVVTVPSDDDAFRVHVQMAVNSRLDSGGPLEIDDVESEVRQAYPDAQIRSNDDLARLSPDDVVWYAYRDSTREAASQDAWWDDPSLARTVVDEDGRYLDANEPAGALFGIEARDIVGRTAGDFTRHATARLGSALMSTLARTGALESTAVVVHPDGTEVPIAFHIRRDGDGPGRHVTVMRPR